MPRTADIENRQSGFTLVELLIGVMILAILAAIAIPSYLSAVQRARETACIGYMRQWPQAQILYFAKYGRFANTDEILVLDQFIGVGLGTGYRHQGYGFEIHAIPGDTEANMKRGWEGTGSPQAGGSNKRYFFTDHTGVIRYRFGSAASRTSTPLGQ